MFFSDIKTIENPIEANEFMRHIKKVVVKWMKYIDFINMRCRWKLALFRCLSLVFTKLFENRQIDESTLESVIGNIPIPYDR